MAHPEPAAEEDRCPPALTIAQCATLACLLEATSPKPGNVHRGVDFENMTFVDFVVSATLIGPAIETAASRGLGTTVREAIVATRSAVPVNTNLGTVLLLAPLACVPRSESLDGGVARVLRRLTADDARGVYEAIRLAEPGGLGRVEAMDVADQPPPDILTAMRAAADRDLVARQYAEDFDTVLHLVVPGLEGGCRSGWTLTEAVVHTHLRLMADFPDSLIARKAGIETARQSAEMAAGVLATGGPGDEAYYDALGDLDFWLRCDGQRRNPGTTADLIAAGLFAALRDGRLSPPWA
jgi:triphosphoribosyl-dephospho-CoA synthase